ncbi:MAG: right-handed parallel beta-helix repeat-containing protein [Deltaproteobacteria bacterium]|nr:right-handed parallel beta-helix repeat-containing protein [Deltaproteobacteria bacterium]
MRVFGRLALLGGLAACSSGDPAAPDASVDDGGDDAGSPVAVVIEAPAAPPIGAPFPVVIATADGAPRTLQVMLDAAGVSEQVTVYRGRGSSSLVADAAEPLTLWAGGETVTVTPVERPRRDLSGELEGADTEWDETRDVRLTADAAVPAGATLTIAAGTRILAVGRVSLTILGSLVARGTTQSPIIVTRAGAEPWGGLRLGRGANASLEHVWFLAGGGDVSLAFGHSASQPVVFAGAGASLEMTGGGVLDSPGKAFGADRAEVTLAGVLVSRCDTGGQLDDSLVTIRASHFLEIPDADGVAEDDDNDGIYLSGALERDGEEQTSTIRDTVFAGGEDDAIDHNGALLVVERAWIEGFAHEGIAASGSRSVTIADSVIRDCGQGIEAGYGSPSVRVEHSLVTGCETGLRYGDDYDWSVEGRLEVSGTIAAGNERNVYNWVNVLGGPVDGAVTIACSMVDDPAWDDRDGNLPGTPRWDAGGCLEPGSPGGGAACDGLDVGPRCE